MERWKKTADKLKAAADKIRFEPSYDIIKILKYGIIESGAGNGGCFSAWVFASGDARHVGAYCYYILWFADHEESFTLDQLKEMVRLWPRQPAEFAGYCGFNELWEFVQEVGQALDDVQTKADLVALVNSLWEYANNLNAWIYHYMPWGAFYVAPTRDKSYLQDALETIKKAE